MTNEIILKQVMKKARYNGWQKEIAIDTDELIEMELNDRETSLFDIIFSHDFAKAFVIYIRNDKPKMFLDLLGNYKRDKWITNNEMIKLQDEWEIGLGTGEFLQQMVLEKEPLSYIAKFL